MLPLTAGTDYDASLSLTDLRLIGCATINQFSYAFALLKLMNAGGSSTMQLSAAICDQGIWQTKWANLGHPPAGMDLDKTFQGTVLSVGTTLWVYVCGGDGHLWARVCSAGIWLDWVKCDALGPVLPLRAVDHALGNFVFVQDANGQAWAMAPSGLAWVAAQQPSSVLVASQGKALAFLMGGRNYCALTISNLSLYPRLYENAGIGCNRHVQVQLGTTSNSTSTLLPDMNGVSVCVAAWLPGNPLQPIYSNIRWVFHTGDIVVFDLAEEFRGRAEDGMLCWVQAVGGRAKTSAFKSGQIAPGSSEANFNYFSNVPSPPQGGDVGYMLSPKANAKSESYWSFSSCSNCVASQPFQFM